MCAPGAQPVINMITVCLWAAGDSQWTTNFRICASAPSGHSRSGFTCTVLYWHLWAAKREESMKNRVTWFQTKFSLPAADARFHFWMDFTACRQLEQSWSGSESCGKQTFVAARYFWTGHGAFRGSFWCRPFHNFSWGPALRIICQRRFVAESKKETASALR